MDGIVSRAVNLKEIAVLSGYVLQTSDGINSIGDVVPHPGQPVKSPSSVPDSVFVHFPLEIAQRRSGHLKGKAAGSVPFNGDGKSLYNGKSEPKGVGKTAIGDCGGSFTR